MRWPSPWATSTSCWTVSPRSIGRGSRPLRQAVPVPLVLHGGSGFPDAAIPDALALGVAKVNFGSALKRAFLAGLVEGVDALPERVSYHQAVGSRKPGDVMQQGKDRLRAEIIRRIRLWRPQ